MKEVLRELAWLFYWGKEHAKTSLTINIILRSRKRLVSSEFTHKFNCVIIHPSMITAVFLGSHLKVSRGWFKVPCGLVIIFRFRCGSRGGGGGGATCSPSLLAFAQSSGRDMCGPRWKAVGGDQRTTLSSYSFNKNTFRRGRESITRKHCKHAHTYAERNVHTRAHTLSREWATSRPRHHSSEAAGKLY